MSIYNKKDQVDISIIIVSYNTKEILKRCIDSIYKFTEGVTFEVIVVDNSSIDGSQTMIREEFPEVYLIESEFNVGFGKANNLGSKVASGNYLFFLNSDCILIENAIFKFFNFYEKNKSELKIGCLGGSLLNNNLCVDCSYQRFPTVTKTIVDRILYLSGKIVKKSHRNSEKIRSQINYDGVFKDIEVDFLLGADLFFHRSVFEDLQGFDEQFFLYFEETDLQKRILKKGLLRLFLFDVKIIHIGGGTTKRSNASNIIFLESQYKYFKKHEPLIKYYIFRIVYQILILNIYLRRFLIKLK